ncbi:FtsW/RodA/SpoVE family cell cycle protein [Collinsella sp. zg1085]|uniref:FtsW/RodA/SpoVE family cell cycle protein n=1 Tax=Collinsella sp. zg1085 TaxID=2844380 RepID=UPI001C0ABCE9|nr:FtsW/RodA/SpoVE family cell cycle protein [Collinsella sp. zg1085]QWT17781.1 FtsW/RodA/SpoVE family cell cycle protein [Collinsella sp. zg1085]
MISRRTTELFLLIAAAFPVVLLSAMYVITTGGEISFETLGVPIGLFAAFAAAHLAVRFFAPGADPAILPIVFTLSGIGITFVTRLKPGLAIAQLVILFVAIALMVGTLALVKNLDMVKRYKYSFGAGGILLLVLPMFIGTEIYGSKLWISIPGVGTIQPGELAKVLIVLFLAGYLAENRELLSISNRSILGIKIPRIKLLAPLMVVWGICMLVVVFEKDLGSALLFYTIFLVMLYVATGRVAYIIIGMFLLIVGALGAYHFLGHVQIRFNTWLNPFADAQNTGYQLVQSLYSLADGGLVGVGIGKGLSTLIPVVESDFIFSAIAEETGLLGGAAILLLYMLFAVRGLTTAARAKSDLAAFIASGLTAAISFQAFLIVGGVTRLIPLTGVTLPFMSQGGSSLLASFIIVALLLRAGDEATGREAELTGTGVIAASSAADAQGLSAIGTRIFGGRERAVAAGPVRVGSRMHKRLLDTPESGVLGRVALANRLTRQVLLFTVLFALLIGNLTYVMVIKAADYQAMAGNNHTILKAAYVKRGSIITSDGVTLAESVQQEDGTYMRTHPNGNLAAMAVGYYSTRFGSAGIEASQNETLTGAKDYSSWQNAINSLAGATQPGNSVKLTIDSRIQAAAERILEGYSGAIVVLDPQTGAVLAWASAPTYNNDDIANSLADAEAGGNTSLFDRATKALYTPGSTYKVITLAAALDSGHANLDTQYDAPGSMEIGGADVTNIRSSDYGRITLRKAFAYSANTVFGQAATEVGADTLVQYSRAFGYGQELGTDFSVTPSIMPDPNQMSTWELAWAGAGQPVGQGHTPGPQTTVLQNAVMAAAIAHDGIVMSPFVVSQTLSPEGTVIKTTQPRTLGQALSAESAAQVREGMLAVVEEGSGSDAAVHGVHVAGKTGTAETSSTNVNSAFVGFAPAEQPTLAVSVMVENYDKHGVSAAALASRVIAAALEAQGL